MLLFLDPKAAMMTLVSKTIAYTGCLTQLTFALVSLAATFQAVGERTGRARGTHTRMVKTSSLKIQEINGGEGGIRTHGTR
jgi:hypothetical protein